MNTIDRLERIEKTLSSKKASYNTGIFIIRKTGNVGRCIMEENFHKSNANCAIFDCTKCDHGKCPHSMKYGKLGKKLKA